MSQDKRKHFRIHYPALDRPLFKISGRIFAVENISESGIAVLFESIFPLGVGEDIRGIIRFKSEKQFTISGKIIRKLPDRVIVRLYEPIPLSIIMEEQRFLLKKYKTLEKAE